MIQHLFRSSVVRFCLLVLMLCGVLLTGSQSMGQASAAELAAEVGPQIAHNLMVTSESTANAPSDLVTVNCAVADIGLNYGDNIAYIHGINCTPSAGSIQFFGVSGADSRKANQLISIGLTAISTGKRVWLVYDPNDTNFPYPDSSRSVLNFGLLN